MTGIRLAADECNDDRAVYAMCASAEFLKASVVPERATVEDLEIGLRSRREFWRMWDREVLADAGFPVIRDPRTRLINGLYGKADEVNAMLNQAMALPGFSAERFAAVLEFTCQCLDAANEAGEIAALREQVSRTIDMLRRIGDLQLLQPYAEVGRKVRAGGHKGQETAARGRGPGRRAEVPKWTAWLRSNPVAGETHHAAACRVAHRFGIPRETVRKLLPKLV